MKLFILADDECEMTNVHFAELMDSKARDIHALLIRVLQKITFKALAVNLRLYRLSPKQRCLL